MKTQARAQRPDADASFCSEATNNSVGIERIDSSSVYITVHCNHVALSEHASPRGTAGVDFKVIRFPLEKSGMKRRDWNLASSSCPAVAFLDF